MPTPTWSAARSGLLGDSTAANASAQANQFLGTHGITAIYQGNKILDEFGTGSDTFQDSMIIGFDRAQPFVMSGTTIGRIMLPLAATGDGDDLMLTLCNDNAGIPGTVIKQVRVPREWIAQLGATNIIPGQPDDPTHPPIEYSGNPLALAQFNTFSLGVTTTTNWSYPTNGAGGPATGPCSCYFGNYFIQMGGSSGSTFYNNVYTIEFDDAGNLAQGVPQPGLPVATDGSANAVVVVDPVTGDTTIVLAGGGTAPSTLTAGVYTASFDGATGTVSAWTAQQSLPGTNQFSSMATYNGYVYVMGGANGTFPQNGVYYAQVVNGQITSWTAGPSLPTFYTGGLPTGFSYSAASNGFLFVFGGYNGSNMNKCAYAPINANGSLGAWIQGPNIPVSVAVFNGNPAIVAGDFGIIANGNNQMFMLGVTANGPDIAWQGSNFNVGGNFFAALDLGNGQWQYYGMYASLYTTVTVTLIPWISVPMPVTGLTNGATYHVVIQGANITNHNNCLATCDDANPGHLTGLFRSLGSFWVSEPTNIFWQLKIFDLSVVGPLYHLYEDNGARMVTFANATTPDGRLLGYLEATQQPAPSLNSNWQFTTGTAPWGVSGGALAQSNAFTHNGLPFSARLTPSGVATQSYIECEKVTVRQTFGYTGTAWVYSPTGYSNVSVILNWYDASNNFISSTFGTVTSVAANTWTFLTVSEQNLPNLTRYGTIGIYEKGTPPVTAVLYVSAGIIALTLGPQLASVTRVGWTGTWPANTIFNPTGVTQLV